jgi:hypothetical protein
MNRFLLALVIVLGVVANGGYAQMIAQYQQAHKIGLIGYP